MRKFCLLAMLWPMLSLAQVSPSNSPVLKGQIRAAHTAEYLPGAVVYLLSANKRTLTDKEGRFQLSVPAFPDTLVISYTGYLTQRIAVTRNTLPVILLEPSAEQLASVEVQTGYQSLPAERATGSFTKINTELFNRKVGASVLDRLDGIASGLIFNRNRTPNANESAIQIRGRSTIFANTEPLIVVDHFPFEGDINQINPNDIESVTLLKDAAASSIWGVRAGNGVIVITTKKARQSAAPKLRFNTNITIGEKPDLYYQPTADAAALVEMESFLFGRGYYNNRINQRFPGLSPAVVIFDDRRAGRITAADSAAQIQQLLQTDNRSDLLRYFYRPSVAQQYALTISGGSERTQYFFSAGWDDIRFSQIGSSQNRATVRNRTQLQIVPGKLLLSTDMNMTLTRSQQPSLAYSTAYPVYQRLVDENGNALPVFKDYAKAWLDTIGQNQLLPWYNKPYDDIRNNRHTSNRLDTRLLTSVGWQVSKGLNLQLNYQLETGSTDTRNLQSTATFFTRDLINRYTQPNYITGIPTRAVPMGDILDRTDQRFNSHNGRITGTYLLRWKQHHRLDLLAGAEIRQVSSHRISYRRFGVNETNATDIDVNPLGNFPALPFNFSVRIPTNNVQNNTLDRYYSLFSNIGYSFKEKYQFSASARKDASNLFGVSANQQTVPLWSVGAGWLLQKEAWLRSSWINTLKLRATYGVSGNIDKTATAFTTAGIGINSVFAQPTAFLINPPNPELSWEKIYMLNLGIDFSLFKNLFSGSFEYYRKKGLDLIGPSPVAPQAGISQFRQNIANLLTTGFDFTINTRLLTGIVQWNNQFLISYNRDEIKRYLVKPGQTKSYVTNITSNPLEGKPWSAVFAYPFAGLDPANGNPLGWLAGSASSNYARLITPANTDELQYFGSGRPTVFGGFRNDISYKQWSLSVNMVYSLGYYFRRSSVNYNAGFSASQGALPMIHADYQLRWRNPGDELITKVPSMVYPAVPARDEFYQYASSLIEKGDHIRLNDIRISWDLSVKSLHRLPITACRFYAYANNIGMLWRANKAGIDPDAVTGLRVPRTYALGMQIDF